MYVLQFVPLVELNVGITLQVLENEALQSNRSWSIGRHRTGAFKQEISILAAEVLKKSESSQRHRAWEA